MVQGYLFQCRLIVISKRRSQRINPMEGVRVLNLNLDFVLQERALTAESSASLHTESQVLKYSIWII